MITKFHKTLPVSCIRLTKTSEKTCFVSSSLQLMQLVLVGNNLQCKSMAFNLAQDREQIAKSNLKTSSLFDYIQTGYEYELLKNSVSFNH